MKSITCSDVGPDCAFTATAETEEELLQQVAAHASEHGITEVTPELLEKVKSVIRDE
jgi:predicted small metal-binding protein